MEIIRIKIPDTVKYIIQRLNTNSYEAFVVGGCVRDAILNIVPHDWDIATNANSNAVKNLFPKTINTGIKHGTLTVIYNNQSFEITTFRTSEAHSGLSLKTDLSLRDFTINAMAYHPLTGLVDPFDGCRDIKNSILRCVENPQMRFSEDPLRMLRAVRFSAQLNFEIEDKTLQAIKHCNHLIQNTSPERIREELTKILISNHPVKFVLLKDTDLLKFILPEFDSCFQTEQHHPYHIYNVAMHTLHAVSAIANDKALRWAMLLHDIGKPLVKTTDEKNIDHFYGHPFKSEKLSGKILRRFKFDNKFITKVCRLVKDHDRFIEPSEKSVRKALSAVGEDIFLDLLEIQVADKKAQNPERLADRLEKANEVKHIFTKIKENNECLNVNSLAINGKDLIALGYSQGVTIGKILNKLLEFVIETPELNTREKLLEIAKNIFSPD